MLKLKKAFTLVEISIVIIIIGVLITIIIKANDVIYNARVQQTFAKVKLLREGVFAYVSNYGYVPSYNSPGVNLTSSGSATAGYFDPNFNDKELFADFIDSSIYDTYFGELTFVFTNIVLGGDSPGGAYPMFVVNPIVNRETMYSMPPVLGVRLRLGDDTNDNLANPYLGMPKYLQCYFENYVDDGSLTSGLGRAYNSLDAYGMDVMPIDCYSFEKAEYRVSLSGKSKEQVLYTILIYDNYDRGN